VNFLDDFGPATSIIVAPDAPRLGFGGIDPGLTGFLAAISEDGRRVLMTERCPAHKNGKGDPVEFDRAGMYYAACRLARVARFVVIEKQQVMPGNGAVGNFTTGFGYGLWLLALDLAGIKYVERAPITWKTGMGIMGPRVRNLGCACVRVKRGKRTKVVKVCADCTARRQKNREEGAERAIELAGTLFEGFDVFDLRRTPESAPSPDKAVALLLAELARREYAAV
jgi:hypothetical protein